MLGKRDNRLTVFGFCNQNPEIAKQLVQKAGCKCENIKIGFAMNQGPRCRNCNTVAFVMTDEFKKKHNLK